MKYIVANLITFILLILIYIIKRNFFPSDIIFYEGLVLALIAGLMIQLCFYFLSLKIINLSGVLLFVIFTSLGPSILYRSVSITVLTSLKNCQKCDRSTINKHFVEMYLVKNKAIDKRLSEQMASGNVIIKNGNFILTDRGNFVYSIIKFVTKTFNITDTYINAS